MKPKLFLILFFTFISYIVFGQNTFRVMSYNVENLFDTLDDPNKDDNEFTPEGTRHWTNSRYYKKINNLAKVITALGEWDTPALIGMCEVENNKVIDDLIRYSPLKKMKYRYVMTESEDVRGIDVAMLYQRDKFKYLSHCSIRISFPNHPKKKTRDILHVIGEVVTGDTLDVFVCHFPSRRGGQSDSEPDRVRAASILRKSVDSLAFLRTNAYILIMGDFNDEPSDKSMAKILQTQPLKDKIVETNLYNLFLSLEKKNKIGSYKMGNRWNFIDQIIVSGNLLQLDKPFHVLPETAAIFHADFISTEDNTHGGIRPKKTFHGYTYEGGYSDHFPVFVDFEFNKNK
jgi:predicted extracellular nuclease